MFLLLKMKMHCKTATAILFLEKHGKYVKGKYSLTGGSVGLFEGKKIGRAKNLEKLAEKIQFKRKKLNDLKAVITQRSNEVIAFNEQLKENTIQQTQQNINELINSSFSIQNKTENTLHQQVSCSKAFRRTAANSLNKIIQL